MPKQPPSDPDELTPEEEDELIVQKWMAFYDLFDQPTLPNDDLDDEEPYTQEMYEEEVRWLNSLEGRIFMREERREREQQLRLEVKQAREEREAKTREYLTNLSQIRLAKNGKDKPKDK